MGGPNGVSKKPQNNLRKIVQNCSVTENVDTAFNQQIKPHPTR